MILEWFLSDSWNHPSDDFTRRTDHDPSEKFRVAWSRSSAPPFPRLILTAPDAEHAEWRNGRASAFSDPRSHVLCFWTNLVERLLWLVPSGRSWHVWRVNYSFNHSSLIELFIESPAEFLNEFWMRCLMSCYIKFSSIRSFIYSPIHQWVRWHLNSKNKKLTAKTKVRGEYIGSYETSTFSSLSRVAQEEPNSLWPGLQSRRITPTMLAIWIDRMSSWSIISACVKYDTPDVPWWRWSWRWACPYQHIAMPQSELHHYIFQIFHLWNRAISKWKKWEEGRKEGRKEDRQTKKKRKEKVTPVLWGARGGMQKSTYTGDSLHARQEQKKKMKIEKHKEKWTRSQDLNQKPHAKNRSGNETFAGTNGTFSK